MENKNLWQGNTSELKTEMNDAVMEESREDFDSLVSSEEVIGLSCDTEIVGTCQRNGQIGQKIKYTCHDSSGGSHTFYVCDIN